MVELMAHALQPQMEVGSSVLCNVHKQIAIPCAQLVRYNIGGYELIGKLFLQSQEQLFQPPYFDISMIENDLHW